MNLKNDLDISLISPLILQESEIQNFAPVFDLSRLLVASFDNGTTHLRSNR